MYTRIVESTTKSGKTKEVTNAFNQKIVPILKAQKGFVDAVLLHSDEEPTRVLGVSFWRTKEDAQRYQANEAKKVAEIMSALNETEPVVHTFTVESSTNNRIAASKAA